MVKKVLFVICLTLALCLSQPADKLAAQPKPPAPATEKDATATELHETIANPESPAKAAENTQLLPSTDKINSTDTVKPEAPVNPKPVKPDTPVNDKPEKPKVPDTVDNKNKTEIPTTNATNESTEKVEPTTTAAPTTVAPSSKSNATTLAPTTAAPVTTDKPANATTEKPMSTTAVPVTAASTARGFDGPSFIGGIILTLGLLAFGFVGFKYYRNQTERNYHTL